MRLLWHPVHPDTPSAVHPPAAVDTRPATRGLGDGPPAGDERRGNTAAVAAYGRLLTGARTAEDPTAEDLTADATGAVHVCGIGLIPIAVALAAVPVDDARHRLLLDPDDQAALDDEATALAHLRHVLDEAATATTTAPFEAGAVVPAARVPAARAKRRDHPDPTTRKGPLRRYAPLPPPTRAGKNPPRPSNEDPHQARRCDHHPALPPGLTGRPHQTARLRPTPRPFTPKPPDPTARAR